MRSTLILALVLTGCPSDYEVIPAPPDVDPGEVTECDFSRVLDTDFYSYDCNPVFTTSGEAWASIPGKRRNTAIPGSLSLGYARHQGIP